MCPLVAMQCPRRWKGPGWCDVSHRASVWYDLFSLWIYQEDSVAASPEVSVRLACGHHSDTLNKHQTIKLAGVDLLLVLVVIEKLYSPKCLEITM